MKYLTNILLLFIPALLFSQNIQKIDSLKNEIKSSKNKAEILNRIALEYLPISKESAFLYADKAYKNARKSTDTSQMGESLWIKARLHLDQSNFSESNLLADSAIVLYKKVNRPDRVLNCEVLKATSYMLQGNFNEALRIYEYVAQKAPEFNQKDIYASTLINMGRIQRVTGKNKESMENFVKAEKIAEELGDNSLKASANHFIGLAYHDQKYFDLAIEYYMKALPLYEEQNMINKIPYVMIDLGASCRESKNYKEALNFLNTAKEYFTTSNDRWGLYELNRNLGLTYFKMKNHDSAWVCFDNSLRLSKAIHEKSGECNSLNYLGEILVHQGKYNQALDSLNKALILNSQINNELMRTNILFNIGKCNVYMGNPVKGLSILKRSLLLANSLDLKYERMVINKEISVAYKRLNKYQKALEHFAVFTALSDSIYREETSRNFAEMEEKYQSEKQKQEIGKLKLDKIEQENMIRRQRSMRNIFILGFLFASIVGIISYRSYRMKKIADSEKEALLKEIHHRVKNNLQIISSLLSIQTESVTDSKVIDAVQESQSRVKAMALIHQLLYQDQNLSQIDFGIYLPQLINAISSIFKKEATQITTEINAKGMSFDIDTAVPLGLIVAELIANAYKYAFEGRKEGLIKVSVKNISKNKSILSVADNGIGLPKSIKFEELNSMGLKLVNILTNQLDGQLNYEYKNGAIFTIEFFHVI